MISMLKTTAAAAIALATVFGAVQASAATLGILDHDYGSNAGKIDPIGSDNLGGNFVAISDASADRFLDIFDLSQFADDTITSFELKLTFARTDGGNENWSVRVFGSEDGRLRDDFLSVLIDEDSPQSFVLSAGTDGGRRDAFGHSVEDGTFEFSFRETTRRTDTFRLFSASLLVEGTPAPVPLPASLPLLVASVGGMAALRRRAKKN